MQLIDVNVLVYAFREDAPGHAAYRAWLEALLASDEAFAVSDQVLASFLRVVTHPKVFHPPTPLEAAVAFVEAFRGQPNAVTVNPAGRHWEIFLRTSRDAGARGNLLPDAWLAALAIEHGCELVTTDRDFARFAALRWHHPMAGPRDLAK